MNSYVGRNGHEISSLGRFPNSIPVGWTVSFDWEFSEFKLGSLDSGVFLPNIRGTGFRPRKFGVAGGSEDVFNSS